MSDIAERIRARLRHVKRSSNSDDSNGSSGVADICRARELLRPCGREESVQNLKLAVALSIYGGRAASSADSIFVPLLGREIAKRWFGTYCLEPYPDVCSCGQVFYGGFNNLRTHCLFCKGVDDTNPTGKMEWRYHGFIARLEINYGIHPSWSEYAIAWSLAKFKPSVAGGSSNG